MSTLCPCLSRLSVTRLFYKTSSYKCHTEHPLDTILYGIKDSIFTLGSSESNRLSDFCEMSMQSILSHLTMPCSVIKQVSDLIWSKHHTYITPETRNLRFISAFCFSRSHYCWVIPTVHLNYCLLLNGITLTLVEVSQREVKTVRCLTFRNLASYILDGRKITL